jgi:hypothetical protein
VQRKDVVLIYAGARRLREPEGPHDQRPTAEADVDLIDVSRLGDGTNSTVRNFDMTKIAYALKAIAWGNSLT